MTDPKRSTEMSLTGYHHLPKVPVMGRNVRTAQSKSSVKMSLDSRPENKDTRLHLDGGSKIVRLLTSSSSEIHCNEMDVDSNGVTSEFIMTNGVDKVINEFPITKTEDVVLGDTAVDSLPVKKKRGRKKKVRNSAEVLPLDHKTVDQSLQASDLDMSVKETVNEIQTDHGVKSLEISGSNNLVGDSPLLLKKKRGRKKKIRSSEIVSGGEMSFDGNKDNQALEQTNLNIRLRENKDTEADRHKICSPGKRKRDSRSSSNSKGRAESSRSSGDSDLRNIVKSIDHSKSHHGQSRSGSKHVPRCVLIKPTEVPSESHLEKLKAMESTSYDLQHPLLWSEGDMLWAKVSGHPYWPCMISQCPFTKMLSRIKGKRYIFFIYICSYFWSKGSVNGKKCYILLINYNREGDPSHFPWFQIFMLPLFKLSAV